jgi:predicted transcriptional regulator
MNDEHLRILKLMNEMTTRTDANTFAQKAGLTSNQLVQNMHELVKQGYLKKVGEGFAMTEKGKTALKSMKPLAENLKFQFYVAVGQPTNLNAGSVKEFRDQAFLVDAASLEFHINRGDFENWFQTAISNAAFAGELSKLRKKNLKGEELRKALIKAIDAEFIF